MTLNEIKAAVTSGHTVCWANKLYEVRQDSIGQWLIVCIDNGSCIGLTEKNGVIMNGKENQFFIKE